MVTGQTLWYRQRLRAHSYVRIIWSCVHQLPCCCVGLSLQVCRAVLLGFILLSFIQGRLK